MATESSPLTFTQGFMLGQISFLLIILLFMRYVVFSPADRGDKQGWKKRRLEREQVRLRLHIRGCPVREESAACFMRGFRFRPFIGGQGYRISIIKVNM